MGGISPYEFVYPSGRKVPGLMKKRLTHTDDMDSLAGYESNFDAGGS
jgi:hypothetical protein